MSDSPSYEGWHVVHKGGTDYEADMIRDRLDDAGIPAVVLTQRDHAFNLNVGDLAPVSVLVPAEREAEARRLLASAPLSDSELEAAAMAADPDAAPAHSEDDEASLDSGNERIRLSPPKADDDEPSPA